jgi:hypothetical protein
MWKFVVHLRSWASALIGREPIESTTALGLIVTGGGILLGILLTAWIPKASDAPWVWALWGLVVLAAGVLTLRGVFAIGTGAFAAAVEPMTWVANRLPFEVRSPFVRREPLPRIEPPLGILDFELAFEQEGERMKKAFAETAREVGAVGEQMIRYTPRFAAATDLSAKERVALSRDFAGKVRPHANRMRKAEVKVRASTDRFSQNYLNRLKAYPADTDLAPTRPSIASLLDATRESRNGTQGYRNALQIQRNINLQQALNEVLDQLMEIADNVLRDIDAAISMADTALKEIDGRQSTTSINRAERRRRARTQ